MTIAPYAGEHRRAVLDLSLRAWEPVFPQIRDAVPVLVYDAFYPDGWRARQLAVDPAHQRLGVGAALTARECDRVRSARYFRDLREQ